jgi:hypothetical protein
MLKNNICYNKMSNILHLLKQVNMKDFFTKFNFQKSYILKNQIILKFLRARLDTLLIHQLQRKTV